jgi:hypothetical protein
MLPAEFKRGDYRFSFRRHTPDGENWVYGGSKLVDGRYVFVAELAVKKTITKPALHRLFLMIENGGCPIIHRAG